MHPNAKQQTGYTWQPQPQPFVADQSIHILWYNPKLTSTSDK